METTSDKDKDTNINNNEITKMNTTLDENKETNIPEVSYSSSTYIFKRFDEWKDIEVSSPTLTIQETTIPEFSCSSSTYCNDMSFDDSEDIRSFSPKMNLINEEQV